MKMKKINVGCGLDVKTGWTNLDNHKTNGADVVFDLNKIYAEGKMPFKDNAFDYILVSKVIHTFMDPVPLLNELVRICKKNGIIEIKTPLSNLNFSIYGKRGYTQGMLMGYASGMRDYNPKGHGGNKLKVVKMEYYTNSKRNLPRFLIFLFNKLPYSAVERSIFMYLIFLNVNVKYRKLN
jgi:ubiquinone/menaquinone biosynthesis C-methylase UbiE